jgi:hypothetical protein
MTREVEEPKRSRVARARTISAFGFTDRQARFLVLVLEHSGVCLPRHYRTFTGIAHGRQTHALFSNLIAGGFAITDLAAPARASFTSRCEFGSLSEQY